MPSNKHKIGDVVTLKSHPLAFQKDGEIDLYINQIPPFMCIKEINIENNKKMFSDESPNKQTADNVKYLCTYFNQHRMEFEDRYVYQEMLLPLDKITFHKQEEKEEGHITLVQETKGYPVATYDYGKRVFFRTFKLERRKKFKSYNKASYSSLVPGNQNSVGSKPKNNGSLTHTSPAFILYGIKPNNTKNIYNTKTGEIQRETSDELYKVFWYNAFSEKFSEDYLPKEFFVDDNKIYFGN